MQIQSATDALTLALHLAITADTENQAQKCIEYAEIIAATLTAKQVERCKMAAEMTAMLESWPRVTGKTRAPKQGKIIACPHCMECSRVYHFAWSGLQCSHCETMVDKSQWIVPPKEYQ